MNVYGIVGWKNSGKTTLVERLVSEITGRGFSVSTVKHAHHAFDVDHEGKDSFRHRVAGASEVLLASRNRWALMHEIRDDAEPPLSELLEKLSPVDLVLIEGYKRDSHAKVEAHRAETKQGLLATDAGPKKKCKNKLQTWFNTEDIYYPNKLNIEQTSSEITAHYKSQLISGNSVGYITALDSDISLYNLALSNDPIPIL